jgi:hypothetical protein
MTSGAPPSGPSSSGPWQASGGPTSGNSGAAPWQIGQVLRKKNQFLCCGLVFLILFFFVFGFNCNCYTSTRWQADTK